ncbi:MAG: hypothetical protein WDM77_16010 [Steroidobacteraceae bacterium]
MMRLRFYCGLFAGVTLLACAPLLHAETAKPFDAAAAFGSRTDVSSMRLSPDGMSVLFVTPNKDQGALVYTLSLAPGAKAKVAYFADGKPYRLDGCKWVANDRLVCTVNGLTPDHSNLHHLLPISRMIAVNADGTNPQVLTTQLTFYSAYALQYDADVIDWLPDQDASVLMEKLYVPDNRPGTRFTEIEGGRGVDMVDTRTLAVKHVIAPRPYASGYISDGRGNVRIVAHIDEKAQAGATYEMGSWNFMYRIGAPMIGTSSATTMRSTIPVSGQSPSTTI